MEDDENPESNEPANPWTNPGSAGSTPTPPPQSSPPASPWGGSDTAAPGLASQQPGPPPGGFPPPPGGGFPAPPAGGSVPGSPQFAAPGSGGFGTQYAEPSQADMALGLSVGGLVSLFLAFCCGPLAIISLSLCGTGLYLGMTELKAIDAGRRNPAKRQNANIARICGGIGVGLGALAVLLFVATLAFG